MSTSDRTMSQVRAILQRLDRSIDQAREKRTHPSPGPSAPAPQPVAAPQPAPAASPVIGQTASPAPSQPARPASPFGRAQPLNRPPQQLRWGS
jgi:hypothetical protein